MKSKKKLLLIAISVAVLLVASVSAILLISAKTGPKLNQKYPISQLEDLAEPHIDLRTLEKSVRLEYVPADKSSSTSNCIIKGGVELYDINVYQTYYAYSLETGNQLYIDYTLPSTGKRMNLEVILTTHYFKENGDQTIEKALAHFPYDVSSKTESETVDARFETCWVSTHESEYRPNDISILVIRDNQIMYLEYSGGFLSTEKLLDELDRIL
ncbi:MAG: hypothetical protein LBQ80_04260 [Clostridium sp.]|jgi:hypothetical protein|nr:hypothetical protein [Clostridium sp.]